MSAIENGLDAPRMERAIVARGRSIDVPDLERRETIGLNEDGAPITRAVTTTYVTGQEIELPADDVARLRSLGYLIYPDQMVPSIEIEVTDNR